MTERRLTQILPTAILAALCAAPGIAWVVEPGFAPLGWMGRMTVLLAAGSLAAAAIWFSIRQASKASEATARYISRLCELEPGELESELAFDNLPLRRGDHHWRALCQRVSRRMGEFARQAEDQRMARAGAEVRARQTATERDQLHEIVYGLTDPVLAIDQFGEIVLANPSAERLLDLPAVEESHPALEQLTRCEQLIGLLSETRRRRSPAHRNGELSLADPEGRQHWYRVSCRTLSPHNEPSLSERGSCGDRGEGHGAVAVLTDITSQKAIQKRNAEFVSSVSHEMKAPLSSIRAYVELLADGEAEDEGTREEFLNVISVQSDRLQRLVENLLNIARIEAGVVKVEKQPLSLNELLTEAVGVMQPQAEQKHVTLASDVSPLYLGVLADRDMLLQGAINLISNAVKYTRDGGQVTVKSCLSDQEVVFEIQDTGVGLSPEDCERVFEKFYRVKKDRDMAPGTGLGLALVKHIVEDVHGGRVEVESELGRGSTFRVVLPGLAQMSA